jgi:hypothetical protein
MKVINEKEYEVSFVAMMDKMKMTTKMIMITIMGLLLKKTKSTSMGRLSNIILMTAIQSKSGKIIPKILQMLFKRMKIDQQVKKSFKDMNINIKDGKKEIHIKTN